MKKTSGDRMIRALARMACMGLFAWHGARASAPAAHPACDMAAVQAKIAAEEFRPALAELDRCPKAKGAARLRGMAYYGMFHPDSAVYFLKAALKEGNKDDTVLTSLADALLWNKETREARGLLDQVKDKQSAPYSLAMAAYHEAKSEFPQALEMYDHALAKEKSPVTQFHKAMVLSWMDRLDESSAAYTQLIETPGLSRGFKAKCRIHRAEVLSWKKDLEKAMSELQAVIKDDPKNTEAHLGLAEILEWQGRYKEAKDQYRDVLLIDPENEPAKRKLEKLLWVK